MPKPAGDCRECPAPAPVFAVARRLCGAHGTQRRPISPGSPSTGDVCRLLPREYAGLWCGPRYSPGGSRH
jgi:hypothetical protein